MFCNSTPSAGLCQPAILLATALSLSASMPAQSESTNTERWFVDASESEGSHYLSLGPAIAKAAPGDVIRVRAGIYDEGFVVRKGIHIRGEPGVRILGNGELGGIRIEDLPADQMFSMRDVILDAPASVEVTSCDGRVLLERVIADVAYLRSDRQVDLQDCEFVLRAADSQLSISRHWIVPSRWLDESATVELIDSVTTMANCKVDGVSAPAVEVVGGQLYLSGDVPGSGYTAGERGEIETPAIRASKEARIWRNLSLPMYPSNGAPPIEGGEQRLVTIPILESQPLEVGALIQSDLYGPSSAPYLMLLGAPTAPREIPGVRGSLWMASAVELGRGVLPKSGFKIDYLTVPVEPALVGLEVTRQLLSVDPEQGLVLSNAETSVVYPAPVLYE